MQELGMQPREVEDPVDSAYRLHSRAVLASLVRLLGGFDLAEEGLHEAFRGGRAVAGERRPERLTILADLGGAISNHRQSAEQGPA